MTNIISKTDLHVHSRPCFGFMSKVLVCQRLLPNYTLHMVSVRSNLILSRHFVRILLRVFVSTGIIPPPPPPPPPQANDHHLHGGLLPGPRPHLHRLHLHQRFIHSSLEEPQETGTECANLVPRPHPPPPPPLVDWE